MINEYKATGEIPKEIIDCTDKSYSPRATNTVNQPKCPTCGSTNIHKISFVGRSISVLSLGLLSNSINKQFECNNCGYKW